MEQSGSESAASESRRKVLKKIGVAGAAAWVAPAVLSQAAHAQGSASGRLVVQANECNRNIFQVSVVVSGVPNWHIRNSFPAGAPPVCDTNFQPAGCIGPNPPGFATAFLLQSRLELWSGTCATPGVLLDTVTSVCCPVP